MKRLSYRQLILRFENVPYAVVPVFLLLLWKSVLQYLSLKSSFALPVAIEAVSKTRKKNFNKSELSYYIHMQYVR